MNIIEAWDKQARLQRTCPHKKREVIHNVGDYILRESCAKCGMVTKHIVLCLSCHKNETESTVCKDCLVKASAESARMLGKLGGLATKKKYGKEHYQKLAANMNKKRWGKKLTNQ